jgi:hypothetical protein
MDMLSYGSQGEGGTDRRPPDEKASRQWSKCEGPPPSGPPFPLRPSRG